MAQLDETILYEQTGELLRYYLTWREKLLGGYIAIIAALVVAFISTPEEYKNIRPWVVAVAFLLTVVFWLFERRNRELFNRCIDVGVALEKAAALVGAFTEINKKPTTATHSVVLDFFFGSACFLLFILTVTMLIR